MDQAVSPLPGDDMWVMAGSRIHTTFFFWTPVAGASPGFVDGETEAENSHLGCEGET